MIQGRVIKTTGSRHLVRLDTGSIYACSVRGKFRIKGIRLTNPIAVGDLVELEPNEAEQTGVICRIIDRKNYIIRKSTKLSSEAHIIAANIDQAFVVATLRHPTTFSLFIDRFLVSAEAYKIPAKIIFNKTDLYADHDLETLADWVQIYESAGYPCYLTSVERGKGLKAIRESLKAKLSVFTGNSGVGKSSIINFLDPALKLRTGEISDAHQTGIHTTTYAELHELETGGWIIDTPGIRGFGMVDIEKAELYHFFPEIFAVAKDCKYHNCLHSHEPDCAVAKAVEMGQISFMRYSNYISMLGDEDDKYRKTPW